MRVPCQSVCLHMYSFACIVRTVAMIELVLLDSVECIHWKKRSVLSRVTLGLSNWKVDTFGDQ